VNVGYGSWGYAYSDASGNRTTTVTNPDSGSRVYVSTIATGRINSVTNELNRTIGYQYDSAQRLTRVTQDEGNYTQFTLDSRGNITETRQVAKLVSGLADLVSSATFPATCGGPSCNQPTSTTDVRGYRTDYVYDGTHGGVLKATSPAPSGDAPVGSGIRPEKRFIYAQFQARYLTSPGTFANGAPVWRMTGISVCATGQAPTCVGTADETLTTTAYLGSTSTNNALPVATTVSAGNGDPTMISTESVTYTNSGDLLTVDGPLAGALDTTRYYYDQMRRRVGIVEPSPDGSATYRATKVTLNEIGQVTLAERGTVTSQTDGAFGSFSGVEKQGTDYDDYGRRLYARLYNGTTASALTLRQPKQDRVCGCANEPRHVHQSTGRCMLTVLAGRVVWGRPYQT
jgi:YD repeat-containing protein